MHCRCGLLESVARSCAPLVRDFDEFHKIKYHKNGCNIRRGFELTSRSISGCAGQYNMNLPVQLRTTLSHASPDKAAEIRSAVTGALKYSKNGMFGFERSVETTFVLPWDLDPCVEPQKLTRPVRDGIRSQLLEESGYG